jgi:hypothetical protein
VPESQARVSPHRADIHPVTLRRILRLWWPLAGSWLLMGVELPLVSAVIARMPDPKIHLAAFSGVVFPIALVIEGPIMMLLAASTALSRDLASYRKLERFMRVSGGTLTALHALVAFTPLYWAVAHLLKAPPEVAQAARLGLMLMTPWTFAIAHRRFNQGLLIRFHRSGEVWLGTLARVLANASVLVAGLALGASSGVAVGAAGFTVGVTVEMLIVGWRAGKLVRGPLSAAPAVEPLERVRFLRFYVPLALSPILMLIVSPMAAAAMNRMPSSIDSLDAWLPVWGLVFLTRSAGFALNEVVVALLGRPGAVPALRRFTFLLAATTMAVLALVAFTPLAALWFDRVSGLPPEVARLCPLAVAISLLMPGYQALQSWYQGALVHVHKTRAVTEAVVIYLTVALTLLALSVRFARHEGIYYALAAFNAAGLAQTAWLAWRARASLRELTARSDAVVTAG